MTQSYPSPNPHLDRGTANPDGDLERTDGGSDLAQNIWDRYGYSPGVIPTAVTLGLARRITGLSTNRVPLLAHIQRRWAGADFSFPRGWSALSYVWPLGFAGTLSPSTKVVQSASETASGDFGRANPITPSRDLDRSQRVVSALPAKVATSTERPTAERIQRRSVGPSISPGKEAPMPRPATGGAQPAGEAQTQVSMANRTENLGVSIVRRYLRGAAARVIQRKIASPELGHLYGFMTADIRKSTGRRPTAHRSTFDLVGPALNRPADDATLKSSSLEAITRQKEERGESLVAEIPTTSSRAVTPLQSVILRKRIGARAKDGLNPDTSEKLARNAEDSNHRDDSASVNGIVPTQPSMTIAQTEADGSSRLGMMVRVQPRHSASATGSTRRSELNQPPVSVVNAHMILRKSSTRQSYEPQGKPLVSPMGLVTAQPAALVVQPQQEGVETKNWQSTGKATGAADRGQASVTVQIPAGLTRLPKPDMVWRKSTIESPASNLFSAGTSAGAKTSLPLTINSAGGRVLSMARQTTTAASPAVEPGTPEGSESPIPIGEKGPEQSNEMDLQQLAEQVSRLIFRKLVVERERRGIGRWH